MAIPTPKRISTDKLLARISGIEYEWHGGFGAVLKSFERGIKRGDTRVIGDTLFYAYMAYRRNFFVREVCWVPVGDIDVDWMREFKKVLFS